jgi:hypothetical protein
VKRSIALVISAAAAIVFALPAGSQPGPTLTIRHQTRGCHSWSFNGGTSSASLSVTMKRGTTLTVIDNDIMPHTFVQVSGPKLRLPASAFMHRMGASTKVTFANGGLYSLTTKAGEDYPTYSKVKTVGADNVLRLKVRVT